MEEKINQHFPFTFDGAKDDPVVYAKLKELTSPRTKPASTTARDVLPAAGIRRAAGARSTTRIRSDGSPAWTPTS